MTSQSKGICDRRWIPRFPVFPFRNQHPKTESELRGHAKKESRGPMPIPQPLFNRTFFCRLRFKMLGDWGFWLLDVDVGFENRVFVSLLHERNSRVSEEHPSFHHLSKMLPSCKKAIFQRATLKQIQLSPQNQTTRTKDSSPWLRQQDSGGVAQMVSRL